MRGRGLLLGIELGAETADGRRAAQVVARAREGGVLLLAGGEEGQVLEISPPLTIAESELETGLELVVELLRAIGPQPVTPEAQP